MEFFGSTSTSIFNSADPILHETIESIVFEHELDIVNKTKDTRAFFSWLSFSGLICRFGVLGEKGFLLKTIKI